MRFYFPHASHTHRKYTAEELELFGRFKERYEGIGVRCQGPDRKKSPEQILQKPTRCLSE